jgi:hypothetical protein
MHCSFGTISRVLLPGSMIEHVPVPMSCLNTGGIAGSPPRQLSFAGRQRRSDARSRRAALATDREAGRLDVAMAYR